MAVRNNNVKNVELGEGRAEAGPKEYGVYSRHSQNL